MLGIEIAKEYLGLQEKTDKKDLIAFFREQAINNDIIIDPSTTPWCSAFMNSCERAVGNPGTGKLNARSWLKYGKEVSRSDVREGDLLVFERGNSSWQGHITYFVNFQEKISGMWINCLGGNQSDSVCYSMYPLNRLLGIRRYE